MALLEKSAGVTPTESSTSVGLVPGTQRSSRRAPGVVKTAHGTLPFVATLRTARGRWLATDYFAPQLEEMADGDVAGMEAMMLLMASLEKPGRADGWTDTTYARDALIDAAKKAGLGEGPMGFAAFSFMQAAAQFLLFAARSCDWRAYLAARIASRQEYDRQLAEIEAARRAEFPRRMAAARAAKCRAKVTAPAAMQGDQA